jgi:hypothetical protein
MVHGLPEGITDTSKLKASRKWTAPRNKYKIRSFQNLYTYYRQFISDFIDIAKPLARLTENKQTFQSCKI